MTSATIKSYIENVQFHITLNNINEFKSYESKLFYVQKQPWIVKLIKRNINGIDSICVMLESCIEIDFTDWAAIAELTVKLYNFKLNEEMHCKCGTFVFYDGTKMWEFPTPFITWNELLNAEKGFVEDDTCILEISLKMPPLQDIATNQLLSFESFKNCCESSSMAKYRITIKNASNFFGACSPIFIVNNMPWRIFFYRNKCFNWKMSDRLLIGIGSIVSNIVPCDKLDEMSMTWSLMPFTKNTVQPLKIQQMHKFGYGYDTIWNVTSMKNLFNPQLKLVENDSFVIEIKIMKVNGKIIENEIMCGNCKKLHCSICLENVWDRSVSSLPCGHLFCTVCIEKALKERNKCPLCNQAVITDLALRPVFL